VTLECPRRVPELRDMAAVDGRSYRLRIVRRLIELRWAEDRRKGRKVGCGDYVARISVFRRLCSRGDRRPPTDIQRAGDGMDRDGV